MNTFCFKAPVVNGEFANPIHAKMYANVLEDMRVENEIGGLFYEVNRWGEKYRVRNVVRKRFRGPRRKNPLTGRCSYAGQSMCLKKDATSVAVYVYKESTRVE